MNTFIKSKIFLSYIALICVTLGVSTKASAQACTTNCLSLFSFTMTNLGTSIRGTVKLIDETGSSGGARSAVVHGLWTRPDGSSFMQYARIGTRLRAEFNLGTGAAPGAYTLEVVDVIKEGYTFELAGEVGLISSISVGDMFNQSPVAVLNSDIASGVAPLSVNFDSAGSYDPETSPLSYTWNFGDGSNSSESNPIHTFSVSGVYTVTLNVTDSLGATTSSSTTVNVTEPVAESVVACMTNCVSVDEYKLKYSSRNELIKGIVHLKDENGDPVQDVTVNAVWTLPDGSTVAQSKSIGTRQKTNFKIPANSIGSYLLTVVSISKAGYNFDPDSSKVQSGAFEFVL